LKQVSAASATLQRLCLAAAALVAAACAPEPVVIDVPEAEIQARVEARFPVETREMLTTVVLSKPDVILTEGSDRIGLKLDILVRPPLVGPFTGTLTASGQVAYRYEEKAFYLVNPMIDDLKVNGLSDEVLAKTRGPIESVAIHYLAKHPVYEFRSRNFKEITAQHVLREVRVVNGAMQAVIAPPL
jgi:hypothetical protein